MTLQVGLLVKCCKTRLLKITYWFSYASNYFIEENKQVFNTVRQQTHSQVVFFLIRCLNKQTHFLPAIFCLFLNNIKQWFEFKDLILF